MEMGQMNDREFHKKSNSGIDLYFVTAPNVKLYVKDNGKEKPVILIHGWPLSNEMWEFQIDTLAQNNCKVIVYDRRGFGKSSQPWDGYDYETLTDDLKAIIEQLDIKEAALAGFSMGGGEVVRYFSRHGGKGILKAVLIALVTSFQRQTDSNPIGISEEKYDGMGNKLKTTELVF